MQDTFPQQKPSNTLYLKRSFLSREGTTSTQPNEPKQDGESLLIDALLLPTARLSKDLLESDVLLDSKTRSPEEARSQEEAVLLSYVKNRQKHHALSVLDGAEIGIVTGIGTGLASILLSFVLSKTDLFHQYPEKLEKGKLAHFLINKLLFHGFEELVKTENTLKSKLFAIIPSVLKTTLFGVLSGVFLSIYLTKHQVKSAKHIANKWHQNSELNQANQADSQNAPLSSKPEKTLTYAEWKHFAENWKHHVTEALKFNFIISTVILGLQMTGFVLALGIAKHEGLQVKNLFTAATKWLEDKNSPVHFLNDRKGGIVPWIKEKNQLANSKAIHESLQKELPTIVWGWLTARFSLLNVARLSMLSVLTAQFWANKNIKHIKNLEIDVQNMQENKTKTNLKMNEKV